MNVGKGQVTELILDDRCHYVRVSCPPSLIPAPGQYLLASDGSDSPLPVPLFYTDSGTQDFIAVAHGDVAWNPGQGLYLRGPLGRGFTLPLSARKVALVALDDSPARLQGLIRPALKQDAAVVLVSGSVPDNLPDDVEVQPLPAISDILEWADYVAFDIARENLPEWKERLSKQNHWMAGMSAQVLVRTPVPCGGLAECGVCAVTLKLEWRLACKDGPVFDWKEL
jgi:NAD(P)H-flavin reductase